MKSELTGIARQAGKIMLKHFGKLKNNQIEEKDGARDLVTFVDREVENYILDRLSEDFPDHGLIGEESGEVNEGNGSVFIIDPIDGTVNYSFGVPHFAISIGRREGNETTHGLIYAPFSDEMYYAEKGNGSSMNGEKISVSDRSIATDFLMATGFACIRAGLKPDGMDILKRLIYQIREVRRLGAATVDLAYVARGIFDGFYEISLSPWDVCAGALIVSEAGGKVTGFGDVEDPIFGGKILATNGRIHDEIRQMIEQAQKG